MSGIIEELRWRGLIHQITDEEFLPGWLASGCRTLYGGFDPTADSLHVGNLMVLMYLRRFQRAGHRPIALVGGATGMIGDPSGKSEERNLLSEDVLRSNVAAVEREMRRFLDFDSGSYAAQIVNNYDWMQRFSFLDFLREVGKNCPIGVMLAKDSVKSRLETGLSYTEFSYMLLQAYDFVHLNQQYECQLQVGGSDQWGNITAGIDLARRMVGSQLYGITCPLLTKADGSKMGKTESGSIWLSADRTSPYAFYQYWMRVADEEAGTCLRFLTELPREEIEALDQARQDAPQQRESQRRLAEWLTELVHGDTGLETARRATRILHGGDMDDVSEQELTEIFADVPSREMDRERVEGEGLPVIDAFAEAGLAKSKGEARRKIKEGGVYVNNRRVDQLEARLTTDDLVGRTLVVLRAGKKRYALLRFES